MNFSILVYYIAQYKYNNDLNFSTYINTIISKIEMPKNEILNFKRKNISMIENNLENNISKIKIYENNFLNSYIIFYFDLDYFNEKENTYNNNSYEHILGTIKDNEDNENNKDNEDNVDNEDTKKSFICTLFIKDK